MSIAAILLGAGASTRMRGADKLLEDVRGAPLLRDRAAMLLRSGCFERVFVVLPTDRPARVEVLDGLDLAKVFNAEAQTGMASSIKAGIAALPHHIAHALIMPADLPDLTRQDIKAVTAACHAAPAQLIRATTEDDKPGSPVIFPRAYFLEIETLEGDESGRVILQHHVNDTQHVRLQGDRARRDLDTPEAWAKWRERQQQIGS